MRVIVTLPADCAVEYVAAESATVPGFAVVPPPELPPVDPPDVPPLEPPLFVAVPPEVVAAPPEELSPPPPQAARASRPAQTIVRHSTLSLRVNKQILPTK